MASGQAAKSTIGSDYKAVSSTVSQSPNWSGYVVGDGPYASVTGTFTVPNLTATSKLTITSEWVGIDGYDNASLIQAGVTEIYDPSTNQVITYPWWEILPAPNTVISSLPVVPGHSVTVTISQASGRLWDIAVTDNTIGQSFATRQTYGGPQTSAEWIVEAPSSLADKQETLGVYSPSVVFSGLRMTGTETTLAEVSMVQGGVTVSSPSPLTETGFSVAYGGNTPPTPTPTPTPTPAPPVGPPPVGGIPPYSSAVPSRGLVHVSATSWSAGPALATSVGGAIVHVAATSNSGGPVTYHRSVDGGVTFAPAVALSAPNAGGYETALAAAGGLVVVAWTAPVGVGVHGVMVVKSTDYGTSWTTPALVSTGDVAVFGVAVASDGSRRVAVSWLDAYGGATVRLSLDRASSFGSQIKIGTATRSLGTALAFSSGWLLAAWRTNTAAIVVRRSSASGTAPWTAPVTIDAKSSGFEPVLSARGSAVALAYTTTVNGTWRSIVRVSTDDGLHWSGQRPAPVTKLGEGVTGIVLQASGHLELVTYFVLGNSKTGVRVLPASSYGQSWGVSTLVSDARFDSSASAVVVGNRTLVLISTNHDPSWATFQLTLDLARY